MVSDYCTNLSQKEAKQRLLDFGANIIPQRKPPSYVVLFFRQFKNLFIYVLLVAAILSMATGNMLDAFFIFFVLLLNAIIGTVQEYSAEQASMALKKLVPLYTTVIRDNIPIKINTEDVVLGDLVQLVSGDKIPADLKLRTAHELQINESMLTGESMAVHKSVISDPHDKENTTNSQHCCYGGTIVVRGRASGEVIATGANTEIGKIAADVEEEQTKPPLLLRIEEFTLRITYIMLLLIAGIFVISLFRGEELATILSFAIALAVSAIPEGLPAAITIALAIGMREMAKVKVIIRKLLAVESLGSCTYIASDKTGTLTVNEMTIQQVVLADGSHFNVSGEGLDLHGDVIGQNTNDNKLKLLVLAGLLANESQLKKTENGWVGQGDMVDVAFLVLASKYGLDYQETRLRYCEVMQIPYESEHAYCASITRFENKLYLFVKGSVEKLLPMCDLSKNSSDDIDHHVNSMTSQGYRVLGLAYKILIQQPEKVEIELTNLNYLGLVGMIDPLRLDAIEAVKQCKKANIKVAMITGDHPKTALALARQAGIANESMSAITGDELNAFSQSTKDFSECIKSTTVFARVSPHQKKQIIEQLMDNGEFVAVTGDGVNDAPALKHAHVGIAMGLRGTDVARESADIILTNDNFSSIVQGITQGRIVYNNIRKVIYLVISTGAAEILMVMLSLLFNTPLPLFPLQLLWLNLVTNSIQVMALAFEPGEGNELQQPPRPPNEPIFNRLMVERVVISTLVMGCLAFIVFKWQIDHGVAEQEARNLTLLMMVLLENIQVLNSRSETCSLFKQNFFSNKFLLFGMLSAQGVHIAAMYLPILNEVLLIQPVTINQWFTLLSLSLLLILVGELYKWSYHLRCRS